MKINMHEAKSQLSALGERVWRGEKIIIAKAGKPYLELLPYREKSVPRTPGSCKGQITIAPDFDETPEEIIKAFEGDE